MGQPFVGEIRMLGFSFAPNGWATCDGQLLPISENEVLFQIIGTTYGGDGQETFALPNLQSRFPVHMGTGLSGTTYQIGEMAGTETVTLSTGQIPNHTHPLLGSLDPAGQQSPTSNVTAKSTSVDLYINAVPQDAMNAQAISPAGGSQPHENCQPFLCINFIISLFGVFPSQT